MEVEGIEVQWVLADGGAGGDWGLVVVHEGEQLVQPRPPFRGIRHLIQASKVLPGLWGGKVPRLRFSTGLGKADWWKGGREGGALSLCISFFLSFSLAFLLFFKKDFFFAGVRSLPILYLQ